MKNLCLLLSSLLLLACSYNKPASVPDVDHTSLGISAAPTFKTDSLNYLKLYLGKRPAEVNLWQTKPLRTRLQELLNGDLDEFLETMQEAQPLQQERVLYTIGTYPDHTAPDRFAFLLVDTANNKLHVSMVNKGERRQYQSQGKDFYLPKEIEERLQRAQ
ncbi:hypothetical protein [Pontibacter ruber]|uniref:DUF4252 domain-containing protein n=1 Tax=Pontibacter ruber TaxID=1343895 RepID=A0ABW5CYX6_9BACT|nr:hypothetical protein [Pontibacter ruber]